MTALKLEQVPDVPEILATIFGVFGAYDVPICVYGGFLRDLVVLGNTRKSQDIDIRLPLNEWCENFPRAHRNAFRLNDAHQRYLERLINDGKVPSDPAMVYRVDQHHPDRVLDAVFYGDQYPPLELVLMRNFVPAQQDVADADIGLCQIAADGTDFWVTEAFLRDQHDRTLTVMRCRNERDAWRTHRRIERFQDGQYAEYEAVWSPEAAALRDAAIAEHEARA